MRIHAAFALAFFVLTLTLLGFCSALDLQLWCVQLDVKTKHTLFQTIDPSTGSRRSLLNTTDALISQNSPSAYDMDTDRIFSISSRSGNQRALIGALLDNVPVVNTHLDHNEDVQVLELNDPSWARNDWRPRSLLINPQARHNLLLLEDDGISIVAQFSGDRQLLYRLNEGVVAPGALALNAEKQKLYLFTLDAKTLRDARLLVISMDGKVIGNVSTSADIRYLVHDEDTDALVFLASNVSGTTSYYGTVNPFSGKLALLGTFAFGSVIPKVLSQPAAYHEGIMSMILANASSASVLTFNVTLGLASAMVAPLPPSFPFPSLVYAKSSSSIS
jgi:hypothetical protein